MLDNTDHQIGDLLAHEIAHSLGLHHTADCGSGQCQNPPCLMSATEYHSRAKGFSQCNLNHFNDLVKDGELPCILNYPKKTLIEKYCSTLCEGGAFCNNKDLCPVDKKYSRGWTGSFLQKSRLVNRGFGN